MSRKMEQPEFRFLTKVIFVTILIGIFSLGVPFILLTNFTTFSAIINSLRLNDQLINTLYSLVNNQNYGEVVLAFYLALATGYIYVLVDSSSRNYYLVQNSGSHQEREFGIVIAIFRLFNYILPVIIGIFILLFLNNYLSGLGPLALGSIMFVAIFANAFYRPLFGVALFGVFHIPVIGRPIEKIVSFSAKLSILRKPALFLLGFLLLYWSGTPTLLKESITLFLLYLFTTITENIAKDIGAITQSYSSSKFFLVKKQTAQSNNLFSGDFLSNLSSTLTIFFISQTSLIMSGLIFFEAAIIIFSYNQGFTIVTPIYSLLGLIVWCTFLHMMEVLPKKKARIYFASNEAPIDVIVVEENYQNGYVHILKNDDSRQKLLLSSISKMETIED